ncbi:hypothetical protein [Burkholderia sp. Ac-20379]|uniref:hypothetical protein n=1 Tax=Burkholderia sp. Ac-20379 TaxID=2703900 RepID=UPI0019817D06|nr:hypothetical protein [Burkholderia sp. Ac-20379]MBN3722600.1 hypothetical protein [Burkholderia sp. Ac-20379]
MKHSELTKKLNAALKEEGKSCGWKTKAHHAFRVEGEMFLALLIYGDAKKNRIFHRLTCKPMAFDLQLWRILGMTGNSQAPLSLRADGAYTLHGISLHEGATSVSDWNDEALTRGVRDCLAEAQACIDMDNRPRSVDAFMTLGEAFNSDLLQRVPNTAWNFWKERLICHLLNDEPGQAASIAEARIAAGDSGGFVVDGQTFYQRALKGGASHA